MVPHMSFTTASNHCITELGFVSADDIHNHVTYRALSNSRNGEWNYASLDIATGETHCSCKGHETGRECWHCTLIRAAWEAHPARVLAAQYTSEQLVRAGTKFARMCRVYRARIWRVLPDHAVGLLACRDEYLKRTRAERDEAVAEVAA